MTFSSNLSMSAMSLWNQGTLSDALSISYCPDFKANSICIDSRAVAEGDLFIGLVGSNCDGGRFYRDALAKGAAGCILNAELGVKHDSVIAVANTEEALVHLAAYNRNSFAQHAKVIGITGSAGKTSTKELTKLALQRFGKAHVTSGNFNNHLGLPLTLAQAARDIDYCVLEMGMNHVGEIGHLSQIARPDIAIITTIAPAHLEFFNSVSEIARAKAEIYLGMNPGGWAIINADSEYKIVMTVAALERGLNILTFGEDKNADIKLMRYAVEHNKTKVSARYLDNVIDYFFPGIIGRHLVLNSLATLAVATILKLDLAKVANSFACFKQVDGRGSVQILRNNIILIDETYNANPLSMMAALDAAMHYKEDGRRAVAILGDMKELGESARALHEQLWPHAMKFDKIHTVGEDMRALYDKLPQLKRGHHAQDAFTMMKIINDYIEDGDVIMVKGSLSVNMFAVVSEILNKFAE